MVTAREAVGQATTGNPVKTSAAGKTPAATNALQKGNKEKK
jgi:hypothetical protein